MKTLDRTGQHPQTEPRPSGSGSVILGASNNGLPMLRLLSLLLISALLLPAADVRAKALEIRSGTPIRINTTSKLTIRAKLLSVSSDSLTFQTVEGGGIVERTMPFSDVRSINPKKERMSSGKAVLITLGAYFLISTAFVVIVFAAM